MSIKLSDKCDECGKSMKKFHLYKTQALCGMCYRGHFMIINQLPRIFDEPFDTTMCFTLGLTKSQKEMIDERVKYLFPTKDNARTKYLRMLILGDLRHWEKSRKAKLKEE